MIQINFILIGCYPNLNVSYDFHHFFEINYKLYFFILKLLLFLMRMILYFVNRLSLYFFFSDCQKIFFQNIDVLCINNC